MTDGSALTGNTSARYAVSTGKVNISYADNSGCKVNGAGNCGGLFGEVVNDGDMTINGTTPINVAHSSGSAATFGGMIGKYSAEQLSDSLTVTSTGKVTAYKPGSTARNYGGLIGQVDDESDAYISISGVNVDSGNAAATNNFGGLIGRAQKTFIELSGSNTVAYTGVSDSTTFAGIVGDLSNGVLYLQDTTDLSGAPAVTAAASSSGQVVGYREYGLVFAADGWSMTRSANSQKLDDIGSWGEIVRFSDSKVEQSDVLTIDSGHFVTLAKAPVTTETNSETNESEEIVKIEHVTDFVKTALNIQLNSGQSTGVLRCDSSTISSTLRSTGDIISLKGDIDLSDTGITGLTRDDTTSCTDFKGFFRGNGNSIKLAVGESYFAGNSANGNGRIYRHRYNGLFARTDGATIQDLEISAAGSINVEALIEAYIGNVVAQATGDLNLSNVEVCSGAVITCDGTSTSVPKYIGGIVGDLSAANDVEITDCTFGGTISGTAKAAKIGGMIGAVSNSANDKAFDITIGDSTVGGSVTAASGNEVGGAIAVIEATGAPSSYPSTARKLTLDGLTVSGLTMNVGGASGGFLGHKWYETDVVFTEDKGVTVSDGSNLTADGDTAGLVHTATGYWNVNTGGITLGGNDNAIAVTSGGTSFGLLVNNGHSDKSAIYLELAEDALTVEKSKVTLALSSVNVFDELVAYTIPSGGDIMENGQGIVSIATADNALLKMGTYGGAALTYQHKTAFLDTNSNLTKNPNTRYYYNLDAYRASPDNAAQELLIWSVKEYAHDSVKDYFSFSGTTIGASDAASLDMAGYSYYPVDLADVLTLNGAVHLYNDRFDATEGDAATDTRLTTQEAQHYMMQNGLFRNVSGNLTFNGSLNGTVRDIDGYCGALITGTVHSSASASIASVNVSKLELAGVRVNGGAGPLLINSAGSNAEISINNVSNDTTYINMGAASSDYIATSLLGTMGSAVSTKLRLSFSGIKLDGRNAAGVTALDGLNSVYNSNGCLFRNAILVDTFAYQSNSGSQGSYNFTYDNDWGEGNRNVTYGAEIDTSLEYANKEKWYSGGWSTNKYTNPVSAAATATAYGSFGNNFMRYVKTPYGGNNHELRVNVESASFGGCGTYNDPYLITDGEQLETIADIIAGMNNNYTLSGSGISIPRSVAGGTDDTWCDGSSDHYTYTEFTYNSSGRSASSWDGTDATAITDDKLAQYLAGAYYKIDPDIENGTITLPATFNGLSSGISEDKYAFRGVFDGSGLTMVVQNAVPFIESSNGCVVRALTLDVRPSAEKRMTLKQADNNKLFKSDSSSCEAYGAVIGKIFGGDNIIDDVSVKFTGTIVDKSTASKPEYVPVGGYVGAVVNGGLIFRRMMGYSSTNANNQNGIAAANLTGFANGVGETPSDPTAADNTRWLYINPIVGRVLNGYVITESDVYKPFEDGTRAYSDGSKDYQKTDGTFATAEAGEDIPSSVLGVTMRNGTKNYSITDIDTDDTDSFAMSGIANGSDITLSSAQAMYIMSLITESGLGKSTNGKYENGGELQPYGADMSTHLSDYKYVGRSDLLPVEPTDPVANASTDEEKANNDYLNAKADNHASDTAGIADKVPYLISNYTPKVGSIYPAFDVAGGIGVANSSAPVFYDLTLSGADDTFYLPDSYRGLGTLMFGKSNNGNIDDYKQNVVYLSGFNGSDKHVSVNMNMLVYVSDNYSTFKNIQSNVHKSNYKLGYGLINSLQSVGTASFGYLTIEGKVRYELIDPANGNVAVYNKDNVGSFVPAAASFIGAPVPEKSAEAQPYALNFDSVDLERIEITGMTFAGGYVGTLNMAGKLTFTACSADDLVVFGGGAAGGLIGYMRNNDAQVEVNLLQANGQNGEFGIKSIISGYTSADPFGDSCQSGAGGFIGFRRTGLNNPNGNENLTVSNVTIRNGSSATSGGTIGTESSVPHAGGIIGNAEKATVMNLNNVIIRNINVYGTNAGGIAGLLAGTNSQATIKNTYVINETGFDCRIQSTGTGASGGFIGKNAAPKETMITDSALKGYTISGAQNVGGLIGHNNSTDTTPTVTLQNIEVSGHTLNSSRLGGLIGYNEKSPVNGYNILINNQSTGGFNGGTVTQGGYIIGVNAQTVKLVGFSRQGDAGTSYIGDMVNSGGYGTGGYVIFADYDGTATQADPNDRFANMQASGMNLGNEGIDLTKTTSSDWYTLQHGENDSITISSGPTQFEAENTVSEAFDPSLGTETVTTNTATVLKTSECDGFIMSVSRSNTSYYLTNNLSGGCITETTSRTSAVTWYFEPVGTDTFKLYTYVNGVRKYIYNPANQNNLQLSTSEADIIQKVPVANANGKYLLKKSTEAKWLQHSGSGGGIRYWNDANNAGNSQFTLEFVDTDHNNPQLGAFNYSDVTINGSSITFGGEPTQSAPTQAQIDLYIEQFPGTEKGEICIVSTTTKKNNYTSPVNRAPYVTTNPKASIVRDGGDDVQWLTGDGVSNTSYYDSAAQSIFEETTNKRYTATGLNTKLPALKESLIKNMTSFKRAVTADTTHYGGEDFPVLIVNDLTTANDTVNGYLKLLTNNSYNFACGYGEGGDDRNIYNVDISKWRYSANSGRFELQPGEASLKCTTNSGFSITPSEVDNTELQISLIDVQFYDPSGTGKIAYHLYVPVVVKKMLYYSVSIRPDSTTKYELGAYPQSVQNLAENLGNPITIKLTYTYQQIAGDWENAINGGENVFRNYNKLLYFKAANNTVGNTVVNFPENAKIVLVDPNDNADKFYSGDFAVENGSNSGVFTQQDSTGADTVYRLDLSSFKDSEGNSFTPAKLNDLMEITLQGEDYEGSKNLVECSADDENLVCIVRNGKKNTVDGQDTYVDLPLRYKNAEDGENETYYAVDVSLKDYQNNGDYVQENYYISIFTKADTDENIYHYEIESIDATLGDPDYPSARLGREAPHLFLGNLYTNEVSIVENTQNTNRIIDGNNNSIYATLEAEVGFTENALKKGILNYIGSDEVKIFQTFLVSLNRLNGSDQQEQRGIIAEPVVTYSDYRIDGEEPDDCELGYATHRGYIEFTNGCNIKQMLMDGCTYDQASGEWSCRPINITETIRLTYDISTLSAQFPTEGEGKGTYIIGYSNISATSAGGAASHASDNTDSGISDYLYYIKDEDTSVELFYNAVANPDFEGDGNGNYGQLGIDGHELDADKADRVHINSQIYYDVNKYNKKSEASYIQVDIQLLKKGESSANSHYITPLDIGTYLDDLVLLDSGGNEIEQINGDDPETDEAEVANGVEIRTQNAHLIYTIPKGLLDCTDDAYSIPVNFDAYSGNNENFEDEGLQYSNYKVKVTVRMLDSDKIALNNSDKTDFIIYTNAKLHSDVIAS